VSKEQTSSEAVIQIATTIGGEKEALPGEFQLTRFTTNQITLQKFLFLSRRGEGRQDNEFRYRSSHLSTELHSKYPK